MSKLLIFIFLILYCVSFQTVILQTVKSTSEQKKELEKSPVTSVAKYKITTTTADFTGKSKDAAFYIKNVLNILICVVGTVLNAIVIGLIIILKEYEKGITHWYALQLAIADLIFLLTIPFKVTQLVYDEWIFPEWMCKAEESILFINYYASILFLMVMSIDRYFGICHALSGKFHCLKRLKSAVIVSCVVWIAATLLTIPTMLHATVAGRKPNCKCTEVYPIQWNYTEKCLLENKISLNACLIFTAIDERPGNCKISFEERQLEFYAIKANQRESDMNDRISSRYEHSGFPFGHIRGETLELNRNAYNSGLVPRTSSGNESSGFYFRDIGSEGVERIRNAVKNGLDSRTSSGNESSGFYFRDIGSEGVEHIRNAVKNGLDSRTSSGNESSGFYFRDIGSEGVERIRNAVKNGLDSRTSSGHESFGFYFGDIENEGVERIRNAVKNELDSGTLESDFASTPTAPINRNSATQERPLDQCHYFDQPLGWKARIAFNFAVMFMLPALVMSVFYGLIIYYIVSSRKNMKSLGCAKKQKNDKVQVRCTIICASLVITFVVCWLPYHAVHLAKWHGIYGQTNKTCEELFLFASVFAFLNSALNPFLYSFILGGFSKRMKEAVRKTISTLIPSQSRR